MIRRGKIFMSVARVLGNLFRVLDAISGVLARETQGVVEVGKSGKCEEF